MRHPVIRKITVAPGTPLATFVAEADAADKRGDIAGIDDACRKAAAEAEAGEVQAWVEYHIGRLLARGAVSLALRRIEEYLDGSGDRTGLLLLRAEAHGAAGDHENASADARAVRSALGGGVLPLSGSDHARLLRVEGLAEADHGDPDWGRRRLEEARGYFLADEEPDHAAVIDVDLSLLDVRRGDQEAVRRALALVPERTHERLLVATALKRRSRYEEAYSLLESALNAPDLDPAHRIPVLAQLVVLSWLTYQYDRAERLTLLLRDTAMASRATSAADLIARLNPETRPTTVIGPVTSAKFMQTAQDTLRLLDENQGDAGQLRSVEAVLEDLQPLADTVRDKAAWHFAAGTLGLLRHWHSREPEGSPALQTAAFHFGRSYDLAKTDDLLIEQQILALRQLGRAYAQCPDTRSGAVWCWAKAHGLEEEIAARQVTDEVRIGMLLAASDEHDERIRAATELRAVYGDEALPDVVVAMEAARGATILGAILRGSECPTRQLPEFGDFDAAGRWVKLISCSVPREQAVWFLYATPEHIHHALVGRDFLMHLEVPTRHDKLEKSVNTLSAYWDREHLQKSVLDGYFDRALAELSALLAVGNVVRKIPKRIRRIVTVAGGALADIPFAALTAAEPPTETRKRPAPLARRYAFSDLPCLSAMVPLHQRSRLQRGDRTLLVSPPGDKLTPSTIARGPHVLSGPGATPGRLRDTVSSRRHQRVRIDTHGEYKHDAPGASWLQLAPSGPDGRLTPEQLQAMNLSACGTLLVGACESGMAYRRGQDERAGFVRAGLYAGAASVLAARWIAEDRVAAVVLDRFERYLRYLPRDLALRRAQLDVHDGIAGSSGGSMSDRHPAQWACWTLYGDPGWQAGAGPLRRSLMRLLD